ncbi:MAG: hypothetical protein IMX01_00045 [Limnochordaceae bacterium]|nr:hypothetical protein [Limnochordaceae bacterium]
MAMFWRLARLQFNVTWGLSAWKQSRRLARYSLLFLPLAFAPLLGGIFAGATWFFKMTAGTTLQSALLALLFASVQLMALILSLPEIISVFYLNDDVNILLPLPIPPWQLVASKFMIVWASEWLIGFALALPVMVAWLVYGPIAGVAQGIIQALVLLLVTLILPILPLAVGSALALGFMRVISPSRGRFKEYLQVAGGVMGLFVGLGINLATQQVAHGDPQLLIQQLTAPGGVTHLLTRLFPPAQWAVWTVAPVHQNQALWGALLLLGVSAIAVVLVGLLAQRWYLTGLLGEKSGRQAFSRRSVAGGDTAATTTPASRPSASAVTGASEISPGEREAVRRLPWRSQVRVCPPWQALFLKEWRMFWRTPGFVAQALLTSFAVPAAFVAISFASAGKGTNQLRALLEQGRALAIQLPLVPLLAAALGLITSFNPMLGVGFSREGRQAWNGLVLPVPPWQAALAKVGLASIVSLATIVLYASVIHLLLGQPLFIYGWAVLWALAIGIAGYSVALAVDYSMPKLDWKNPMEVAQNSLGGLLASLGALLPTVVLAMLGIFLWIRGGRGPLFYGTLLAATLVIDALAGWILVRAAARRAQIGV